MLPAECSWLARHLGDPPEEGRQQGATLHTTPGQQRESSCVVETCWLTDLFESREEVVQLFLQRSKEFLVDGALGLHACQHQLQEGLLPLETVLSRCGAARRKIPHIRRTHAHTHTHSHTHHTHHTHTHTLSVVLSFSSPGSSPDSTTAPSQEQYRHS